MPPCSSRWVPFNQPGTAVPHLPGGMHHVGIFVLASPWKRNHPGPSLLWQRRSGEPCVTLLSVKWLHFKKMTKRASHMQHDSFNAKWVCFGAVAKLTCRMCKSPDILKGIFLLSFHNFSCVHIRVKKMKVQRNGFLRYGHPRSALRLFKMCLHLPSEMQSFRRSPW